jgi:hypothetical protein
VTVTLRRSGAVAALTLLAVLSSCRTGPEPVPAPVDDTTTFLGLAAAEAARITDAFARADLYATIASGYEQLGDQQNALAVATAAADLIRSAAETADAVEVNLRLAPVFAAVGDDAAVVAALESAIQFVVDVNDPVVEAALLPRIVSSGIASGEAARPLLRRAVDEVFVIEDPRYRAEALLEVGERYQRSGVALSATGLIHQASPAVRSIPDLLTRARLFGRLASLAEASGEPELAGRLARSGVREFLDPDAARDGDALVAASRALALAGRWADVAGIVGEVDDVATRIGVLLAAAQGAPVLEARRMIDASIPLLDELTDAASFISAEIATSRALLRVGERTAAVDHALAANGRLAIEPTLYSRLELPSALATLYVELNEVDRVRDLLLLNADAYVRGAVAVTAGDALSAELRFGLADDFYTIALIASDETTYLADGLRQSIVRGFAGTGSIRLAIRTVERMQDELLRARSVATLAAIAEPAGNVTAIYRADLASVLSRDS